MSALFLHIAPSSRLTRLPPTITAVTTQPPNRRLALIREGLGYLGLGTSDTLRSWQFGVETTPMQVKARVLDPPQLVYAGYVVRLLCCQ